MDNSKLDQGKSPFSSLSQIKVKEGTCDGPATSDSESKRNRNLTQSPHHGKSSNGGSWTSDTAVIDTGSPIASVKDAVSMFGSPIPSVKDAASKFGGATNFKTNRVQSMERRKSFQEPEKVQEEIPVLKKTPKAPEKSKMPEESKSRIFIERRKSFEEPEKVQEATPVLKKPSETTEGSKTPEESKDRMFIERRKSFQEPEKVQEATPVLKKPSETAEESKSRSFIERRKSFQEPKKVQDETPVLKKPLETAEESRSRSLVERRKSFQESEQVQEQIPVLKKPSKFTEESSSRSFIERFKSLEKAQEEKPVLKRQSDKRQPETDSKNRLLKERQISLEKVQEDLPVLKKQWETAEESKNLILKDLNRITKLIEEHKLNLENAQKEEHQAKQDSEFAKRRVEELEKGIDPEASAAAKAQLEVAKGRTLAAESELLSLKDELNTLRKDHSSMINDRDTAVKNAEKTVSASKEVEKTVENLTIDLRTTKTSLESAHAAKAEAEGHRTGEAKAQEQDILNLEKNLKQAEEELQKLNQKFLSTKEYRSRLDTACALLQDLKAELAAYMELKLKSETTENSKENLEGQDKSTDNGILIRLSSAKKNLEEVMLDTEKAKNELNLLKEAATPLKSQLESEKLALEAIRQREEMVSVTVASTEAELNRTMEEISIVQAKEREVRDEMVELPKKLQKATEEADQAKSLAKVAHEELQKATEEVDQVKSRESASEGTLVAAKKKIEAAKAAENLALATINALQETETAQTPDNEDSPSVITISSEEYYKLNKQAHEAEVQGNLRVTESLSHAEGAKQSQSRSLIKLEEISSELATKKESLEIARQKAEKANERKVSVEQELTKWRAKDEEQKSSKSENGNRSPRATFKNIKTAKNIDESHETDAVATNHGPSPKAPESSNTEPDLSSPGKKKKKSLFPRLFMFLGKKKASRRK
ncbi:Protein WEAK CHLOROPLAST MOVEMENT UNDER BLUE LIGHT 1 [Heracleum sosnowskyi]|uniref:Protein WEAK CHLOROPLAST MOVEMENT UNDER BLUE LIGHT 1 n=1 Tax=Heracleum sosnowskyi TaxID=360622 RepID=A0AAD8JM01_9APIA|nr:Protein WEAK CHLOROPLAST MOVEMENT UNDER BLUE LIGHT 1 [Heracleum sosnowskyi]